MPDAADPEAAAAAAAAAAPGRFFRMAESLGTAWTDLTSLGSWQGESDENLEEDDEAVN